MRMLESSGKAQSSSSMTTPLRAPRAAGTSKRLKATGWSRPEHRPAGDPEKQAVGDLAGRSGDRHFQGLAGAGAS